MDSEHDNFIVRCCVCGAERVAGQWKHRGVSPEATSTPAAAVSHTYCPSCVRLVRTRIKRLASTRR